MSWSWCAVQLWGTTIPHIFDCWTWRWASMESSFCLNVSNVSYEPLLNLQKAEEDVHGFIAQYSSALSLLLPRVTSPESVHAPLHNVSFQAHHGKITAILSNDISEQKSLIDIIINRRFAGSFDGDVHMIGVQSQSTFNENLAFVHRVSSRPSSFSFAFPSPC